MANSVADQGSIALTQHSVAHRAVLERLQQLLPDEGVITDSAGLRPYETDGLTAIREMPWVVALPETEEQVAAIVRCCAEHGVPVIPRGAGTGLSGGARPHQHGVVLGLSKMSEILTFRRGIKSPQKVELCFA